MEKLSNYLNFKQDTKLQKQMKDYFLSVPIAVKYIASLKLTDEQIDKNINKIYEYAKDISYCNNCPGLNKCQKTNPHLCTKIIVDNGFVDHQLVLCKKMVQHKLFLEKFKIRDFDESWINVKISSLDKSDKRREALARYAQIIENNSGWIYLMGEENSGRSYFAAALGVDLVKRNIGPLYFLNASKRINELKDYNYSSKDHFDSLMEQYSSCPILVLDDFGNEFKNDFIRDAIVFDILSKRSSKGLITIFTSDFTIKEIEELYSTSKAGAIRAKQIGKLLSKNCGKEINLGDISVY